MSRETSVLPAEIIAQERAEREFQQKFNQAYDQALMRKVLEEAENEDNSWQKQVATIELNALIATKDDLDGLPSSQNKDYQETIIAEGEKLQLTAEELKRIADFPWERIEEELITEESRIISEISARFKEEKPATPLIFDEVTLKLLKNIAERRRVLQLLINKQKELKSEEINDRNS